MDVQNTIVKRYETRYLILILSILLLCILDAHFTMNILQMGGIEMNPIMSVLLEENVGLMLVMKYVITASGLILLLVYKNFRIFGRIRVSSLIYMVFGLYVVLVLTEALALSKLSAMDFPPIF